ncbi:MAG: uracil-DNA glycosylase [Blastocatellia bacterium]
MNNQKIITEDLLALTLAIKNQLEFYQEIGVTDIIPSNYLLSDFSSVINHSKGSLELTDMAKKNMSSSTDQLSLFETDNPKPNPTSTPIKPSVNRSLGKATLIEIRAEVGHCCGLCPQATQIVFGEGNPQAELMFIGEAPGAEEDATGRPFVGAAGKLLDKIIAAIGFKREDVYITNVVKCRPPNNRKPTSDEMSACEPFLFNEIELVKPKLIVTLGATPLTCLLDIKEGITKIRGQFYDFQGIPVMPTFHPAFLLRVPEKKREVWEDMKQVMNKLKEIRKTQV